MMDSIHVDKINDFFEKLTIEEFDEKLEAAGITMIESSSENDMGFFLELKNSVGEKRQGLYSRNDYIIKNVENNYNFSCANYLKAV